VAINAVFPWSPPEPFSSVFVFCVLSPLTALVRDASHFLLQFHVFSVYSHLLLINFYAESVRTAQFSRLLLWNSHSPLIKCQGCLTVILRKRLHVCEREYQEFSQFHQQTVGNPSCLVWRKAGIITPIHYKVRDFWYRPVSGFR
jgi:hypothetical protein